MYICTQVCGFIKVSASWISCNYYLYWLVKRYNTLKSDSEKLFSYKT